MQILKHLVMIQPWFLSYILHVPDIGQSFVHLLMLVLSLTGVLQIFSHIYQTRFQVFRLEGVPVSLDLFFLINIEP